MLFALLAAILALAVAGVLVRPLLAGAARNGSESAPETQAETEPEAQGLAVFRDQLAELERDAARGLIGKNEAEAARAEIARRILASSRASAGAETGARELPAHAMGPKAALGLAAAVLLSASALYLAQGAPLLPSRPFAERAGEPATGALEAKVRALSKHLESNLEDAATWAELGDTLMQLGRPPQAAFALDQAVRLTNRTDPALLAQFAEARVWAIGGLIGPEARGDFEAALKLDPANPRALYYLGLAALHDGDTEGAARRWRDAHGALPDADPWRARIGAGLQAIESGDTAALMPGPSAEAVRAVRDMSPEDRQNMIAEMVGGLRARLEDAPEDMEGWLRLGQSYRVLEQPEEARYAYERALALNPQEPEALWQLGDLERDAGDTAAARGHWQTLLTLVPEGSEEHTQIGRALESLNRN